MPLSSKLRLGDAWREEWATRDPEVGFLGPAGKPHSNPRGALGWAEYRQKPAQSSFLLGCRRAKGVSAESGAIQLATWDLFPAHTMQEQRSVQGLGLSGTSVIPREGLGL